jgi:hypothetical protein
MESRTGGAGRFHAKKRKAGFMIFPDKRLNDPNEKLRTHTIR